MNYQEKLDELSNTETAITWLNQMRKQPTKDYDPLVTYLFINKDLQMSAGKLAVQCARAGQLMLYNELKQANCLAEQSLLELTQYTFICIPTEDSHFKECVGRSPVSKWEMNVGWR